MEHERIKSSKQINLICISEEKSELGGNEGKGSTGEGHLEGFGGIADWSILGDVGVHEEAWNGGVLDSDWWVSALSPGGWGSDWCIE